MIELVGFLNQRKSIGIVWGVSGGVARPCT